MEGTRGVYSFVTNPFVAPRSASRRAGGRRGNQGNVPLRLMAVSKEPKKGGAGKALSGVARLGLIGLVGVAIVIFAFFSFK